MIEAFMYLVFFILISAGLYGSWLIVEDKQKAYEERKKNEQ